MPAAHVAQPDWLPQHHRRGSPLAVASGCPLPTTLNLSCCHNITNAAVVAVALGCELLMTLELGCCDNITDAAVVAVASE